MEAELKLDDVPQADADMSVAVIPANSSTLTWYWADFGSFTVIVAPDASVLTLSAESTSKRSLLLEVFWSRAIA